MVKHFRNLLLRNQWEDFDETRYEASETQAHQSLFVFVVLLCVFFVFLYNPWLILTYFMARLEFATFAFILKM